MEKLDDITNAVSKALTDSCSGCGITNNIIDIQSLNCFHNSHTYVTYQARLEGTSETDSGSLISLLENWVSGRPSISVTGILMRVEPECPVAISCLSEGECKPTPTTSTTSDRTTSTPQSTSTTSSTDSTTSSSPQSPSDNTAAIIRGVVAIIFIIAIVIVIAIIGIITFKLRSRGAIKKAEE